MKAILVDQQRVNEEKVTTTATLALSRKEYQAWIDEMDEVGVVELALVKDKTKNKNK